MMEVAGLAAGVISLASLFSSCIEGFNLVQMGRAKNHDVAILHQKLDNQKARFIAWGESIYLNEGDRKCLLDASPWVRNSAANTMHLVASLCRGSEILTARYGLRVEQSAQSTLALTGNNGSSLRHVFVRVYSHIKFSREDRTQFSGSSLRWVISDREQYLKLVQDLRDLIDDLESLTSSAEAQDRRQRIIREDVDAAPEEALPIIEEAGEGGSDSLSDAASMRLSVLRLSSIESGSNRVSSATSFRTAPERQSRTAVDPSLSPLSSSTSSSSSPNLSPISLSLHDLWGSSLPSPSPPTPSLSPPNLLPPSLLRASLLHPNFSRQELFRPSLLPPYLNPEDPLPQLNPRDPSVPHPTAGHRAHETRNYRPYADNPSTERLMTDRSYFDRPYADSALMYALRTDRPYADSIISCGVCGSRDCPGSLWAERHQVDRGITYRLNAGSTQLQQRLRGQYPNRNDLRH